MEALSQPTFAAIVVVVAAAAAAVAAATAAVELVGRQSRLLIVAVETEA